MSIVRTKPERFPNFWFGLIIFSIGVGVEVLDSSHDVLLWGFRSGLSGSRLAPPPHLFSLMTLLDHSPHEPPQSWFLYDLLKVGCTLVTFLSYF